MSVKKSRVTLVPPTLADQRLHGIVLEQILRNAGSLPLSTGVSKTFHKTSQRIAPDVKSCTLLGEDYIPAQWNARSQKYTCSCGDPLVLNPYGYACCDFKGFSCMPHSEEEKYKFNRTRLLNQLDDDTLTEDDVRQVLLNLASLHQPEVHYSLR